MKKRIFWNMCLVALITIGLSTVQILGACYDLLQDRTRRQIENETTLIGAALNGADDREGYLAGLSLGSDSTRITLINPDGKVTFDSVADPARMDNHIDRPEVVEAVKNGRSQSVRVSSTIGKRTYYFALLLTNGQILRLSITTQSIYLMFLYTLPAMLLMVLTVAIIVLFFSAGVTQKIVSPLNAIDLDHPAQSATYDELAPFMHRILQQQRQISSQMAVLRSQKDEFSAITQNMREGLVVLDANMTVLSLNNSAAAVFPGAALSPEGENFLVLTRNLTLHHQVKATLTDGASHDLVAELSGRSYQFFISPVFHEDKKNLPAGAIIMILDVTEKQEAEKVRREFSANVSHELKTPLTSILGYAELLEHNMVKESDVSSFAEKIHAEASRLLSLIEDIIKLSRLDETAPKADFIPVDLAAVTHSVIERLAPQARQKGVEFSVTGEALCVLGHPGMLEEMIFNLCDNAIRYNKEQGRVAISLEKTQGGPRFTIEDTGIGIPPVHQSRVFERFYRVDKSHSKQTGGTGLGLSIVKHIAQYHKAAISLKSTPDVGTVISIIFPAEEEAQKI